MVLAQFGYVTGRTPGAASFETVAIATSSEPPFMLPRFPRRRCATRHKLGIQKHTSRASRQIATLFERAAWPERRPSNAAVLAHIYQRVRRAWTTIL